MDTQRTVERDPLEGTSYRTLAILGRGGMGLVLEAEHRKLQKRVCVKILHEGWTSDDFTDRMQLEARSLAALDGHANVVLATDFGETPSGRPFLVMERLYGRTLLEERNARGPIPPQEAIDLTCQALAGLEAVHALGVVHRDIKLGNLFVCNAKGPGCRVVKLLDFGAAKLVTLSVCVESSVEPRVVQTAPGTVIGSPRYMAPEQIACTPPLDHRADLYAMGAVLFSVLTGRGPFDDRRDHVAIVLAHLNALPAAPSALSPHPIPEALDRAILRALAKKPDERFPDAASFAAALQEVARDLRATAKVPQQIQHVPPIASKSPELMDNRDGELTLVSSTAPRPLGGLGQRWLAVILMAGVAAGILLGLSLLGVMR